MIVRDDKIHGLFKALLKDHTQVDIATAWATRGKHLRILTEAVKREHRPVKVRAIVGTAGNATHPDALEELYRITNGDLRIIGGRGRLFHPKLYLFRRHTNGPVGTHAWVGSANFTTAGFGGRDGAKNVEILVQIGPGETADELAGWFRKRWHRPLDRPVRDMIRRYRERWKRNPPRRDLREMVSPVSRRVDLLDEAYRPMTLEGYRQALKQCEDMLQDEDAGWRVLDHQDWSYMKAIYERQRLLLGEARWSQLDHDSQMKLKGGVPNTNSTWWGLLGRMSRAHGKEVFDREDDIRPILDQIVSAEETEFPNVAVEKLRKLKRIPNVGHATATLLLTLARPDRLLSLNGRSARALSKLSGEPYSTLGEPHNYRKLLQWLYAQPWYVEPPPTDGPLMRIGQFRAALVDAFAYNWT